MHSLESTSKYAFNDSSRFHTVYDVAGLGNGYAYGVFAHFHQRRYLSYLSEGMYPPHSGFDSMDPQMIFRLKASPTSHSDI